MHTAYECTCVKILKHLKIMMYNIMSHPIIIMVYPETFRTLFTIAILDYLQKGCHCYYYLTYM